MFLKSNLALCAAFLAFESFAMKPELPRSKHRRPSAVFSASCTALPNPPIRQVSFDLLPRDTTQKPIARIKRSVSFDVDDAQPSTKTPDDSLLKLISHQADLSNEERLFLFSGSTHLRKTQRALLILTTRKVNSHTFYWWPGARPEYNPVNLKVLAELAAKHAPYTSPSPPLY